jgi:hypothetical protein
LDQVIELRGRKSLFESNVNLIPYWLSANKQRPTLRGKNKDAAAAILIVLRDRYQSTTLEWFECGGESGSVHSEKVGDGTHCGGLETMKRHENRELPVSEFEGTEGVVEASGD